MAESRRIAFIINPHSGTSSKDGLADLIKKFFLGKPFSVTTVLTQRPGHGRELAAGFAAEGYDAVVACGGDGTVNEVASALPGTGTALGILPLGSGNGLGRHLGLPLSAEKALQVVSRFNLVPLDYGEANGKRFFCTCGSGFDAQVAWDFAQQGTRGLFTYVKVSLQDYFNFKPQQCVLSVDGSQRSLQAFIFAFANANQYGNNAFIAPSAKSDDGLLEVTVVKSFGFFGGLKFAWQMFRKTLSEASNSNILQFRGRNFVIKRPQSAPFHLDGDPFMLDPDVSVSIHHGELNVLV